MAHRLKIILLLIAGLCYLTSVFELDKDECKENFAKEQGSKVCCTKIIDGKTVSQIATIKPIFLMAFDYGFGFSKTTNKVHYNFPDPFIPPDKLFLQHRALLI